MHEQKKELPIVKQHANRTRVSAVMQKKSASNQTFGFADNRAESIENGKIIAGIQAKGENVPLQRSVGLGAGVIQRQISDNNYNTARAILIAAGSNSAAASHPKHTQGAGSPDGHGIALLQEARDEFRAADVGQPGLVSGMTQAHYGAIHNAADQMGIVQW